MLVVCTWATINVTIVGLIYLCFGRPFSTPPTEWLNCGGVAGICEGMIADPIHVDFQFAYRSDVQVEESDWKWKGGSSRSETEASELGLCLFLGSPMEAPSLNSALSLFRMGATVTDSFPYRGSFEILGINQLKSIAVKV